ncbi:uncharacterized protein LOC132054225 [Lycium ferocissimum]|uniref:uncharacterized protein LOC132054225 n=1 Tax=Lycium ferocissimum TaxID=112874 RepID=UPI0028158BAD|nr:uncharacterized protein LOC132054225 [Lycium ferocissimum]
MEPFQHVRHLQYYRRRLRMNQAGANCNRKIWFFVADNIEVEVLSDSKQQISLKLVFHDTGKSLVTTLVYAKCNEVERLQLWDSIYSVANSMSLPWMIGGDFNVVLNDEEKIGGIPVLAQDIEDFAFCINSCELEEIQFKGSPFTWWNGRASNDCIFERLDRMLVNSQLQNWFSHMEVEHESFFDTVEQNCPTWMHEDPFISFKLKLKHMKRVLSPWSRSTYGDIFKQLIIRVEIYLHYDEEYWRQKSGIDWFVEGDRYTKVFHNLVKGRRKRLQIQRIHDLDGNWLDNEEEMANEAVKFYHKQFIQEDMGHTNEDILQHILCMLDQESNEMLCKVPLSEEVKAAVFNLSGSSASRPDAFQVYSIKLEKVLPSLISPHQAGFVKGRSIIENVLLTQEVVTDIRKRGKPANVVLKLDLAKMRFSGVFIDRIWRLIANNWYSILFNGKARGFFHSTRGVKQSDPLSPALFILTAEVLSRALNSLYDNSLYVGYGLPKWSANNNHLAYTDDTITFAFAERNSLEMIIDILRDYEAISGQLINIEKSAFNMYHKVADRVMQDMQQVTGFTKGQFPFKYLGCPIFHARKKKVYYQDFIKKVKDKLQSWKGKLMSYGGKAVLIGSVLQSVPVYVLSAIVPTKYTLNELHRIFARFFWSNKEEDKSKHWVSWKKICMPKAEGGLGFRSLFDISKALFAKLWWRIRTSNSLWSTFLWNKYCKKLKPTSVQWKGGSQVWTKML